MATAWSSVSPPVCTALPRLVARFATADMAAAARSTSEPDMSATASSSWVSSYSGWSIWTLARSESALASDRSWIVRATDSGSGETASGKATVGLAGVTEAPNCAASTASRASTACAMAGVQYLIFLSRVVRLRFSRWAISVAVTAAAPSAVGEKVAML